MVQFDYVIKNPVGLHAKPARELVELIKKIDSKVYIASNNNVTDASKFIRVISMGLVTGSKICVKIDGGDEKKSLQIIKKFFEENV